MGRDLLFDAGDYIFSCRVAAVVRCGGRVLFQRTGDDSGLALPGGHIEAGETAAQALAREFYEELNAPVSVGALLWTGENFFTMRGKKCHQLCLYFEAELPVACTLPREGVFHGEEWMRQGRDIEFLWVDTDGLDGRVVYPPQLARLLGGDDGVTRHFIYDEQFAGCD